MPGQTLNVDLLFVPACHRADIKLPAVSGSSGHLVVERLIESGQEPDYPGRVFAYPALDYTAAMQAFVQASQPLSGPRRIPSSAEKPSQRAEIRQLHQKEAELGAELRQLRQLEDLAWQASWQAQRGEKPPESKPAQLKVRADWGSRKPQIELRRGLREQRRQQLARRKQADERWRLARQNLREQLTQLPVVTAWIAILLVTDNCTRQCLGLPLFLAGSHVTAEMVVAALRVLLPVDLQFVTSCPNLGISDRGVHFTADVFRQLAKDAEFVHVVFARHRPQSNGIAERFVRTIKEWLADKAWASDTELLEFLNRFLLEFNDRPHQGLPSPGLSPNEFAKRLMLM